MKNASIELDDLVESLNKIVKKADALINGAEKQLVLEIGNQATKMFEYVVKKTKIEVTNGFVVNTPTNALIEDKINAKSAVANVLAQALRQNKIKTKEFIVSIVSKQIIIREMDIPQMKSNDLKSFVQINSKDIFPVNLANYILGYCIISKGEKNRIMIAAIPKEIVQSYIDLGDKLGLTLKGVNYSGYELYNFLDYEIGNNPKSYLAIDIGARNTNIIIIKNSELKFNKIIPKGFAESTQFIAEELNCELNRVEQLKRRYNSLEISEDMDKTSEAYIIAKYTRRVLDNIIQDVTRITEFYNSNNVNNKISQIYIIGVLGKIKGIEDYFNSKLNVPTKSFRTLKHVTFKKNATQLSMKQLNFINCYGTANLKSKEFIILKDDMKIRRRSFVLTSKFNKIAICIAMLFVLFIVSMGISANKMQENIDKYQTYIDSKSKIEVLQSDIRKAQKDLDGMENTINNKIGNGAESTLDIINMVEKTLKDLANGATINITSYKFGDGNITFGCRVVVPEGLDPNSIEALTYIDLPYNVKDEIVKQGYSVEMSPSNNYFTLKISIKEEI